MKKQIRRTIVAEPRYKHIRMFVFCDTRTVCINAAADRGAKIIYVMRPRRAERK